MSELNHLLQDILNNDQGDIDPSVIQEDPLTRIEDGPSTVEAEEPSLATEENILDIRTTMHNEVKKEIYTKETLEKFNSVYRRMSIVAEIGKEEKLDKKIVLEAYAAMPEEEVAKYSEKLIEARLSTAPSEMNKKLFNELVVEKTLSEQEKLLQYLRDSGDRLKQALEVTNSVIDTITSYHDNLKSIYPKNKYIVLYDNKSYNLLTGSIFDISCIRSSEIEYDRYKDPEFDKLTYKLYEGTHRDELLSMFSTDDSVTDVIDKLSSMMLPMLNGLRERLTVLVNHVETMEDKDVLTIPVNLEELQADINNVYTVKEHLEKDDNLLDTMINFIRFIV